MRNVYLSFLGLGVYQPTVYKLGEHTSSETKFVQVAEIELLGAKNFDTVLIAATPESFEKHAATITDQLESIGATVNFIDISNEMTPETQWKWFEHILSHIQHEDRLTVDMTHGFRAIPILFSSAINFLQKSRNISLQAVYYGVFEQKDEKGRAPIVDMKGFYLINEWADAVSRLVEEADARKMAEVARKTTDFQAGELNDQKIIAALDDLTNTVRNVDVNNVAQKANTAIRLIQRKKEGASETGQLLLNLVFDKFVSLCTETGAFSRYDREYFKLQIEIIRLLLEHKLFMQAYTVMREFIASLVMVFFERRELTKEDRNNLRGQFADVFFNMFQFSKWNFSEKDSQKVQEIMPFYEELKANGIENEIRGLFGKLAAYRNGFDHAWIGHKKAPSNIAQKGDEYLEKLQDVMKLMDSAGTWNA